jgi:hypothetical protein
MLLTISQGRYFFNVNSPAVRTMASALAMTAVCRYDNPGSAISGEKK